jgi:CRP/FNR family transcriptional regulator, cyclic AMP receptor protein
MKARRDVKVDSLRMLSLFEGCSDHELVSVARLCDEIAVPAGYVLVHEGDWGDEAFIVIDGEAEVAVEGRQLAVAGPSSFIGEMAVIDHGRRTASVAAITPMRLFVLESRAFTGLLDELPLLARRLMSEMSKRLRVAQGTTA